MDLISELTGLTPEEFAIENNKPAYIPYVVNGDAKKDGWTAFTLAAALTEPLAAIGVTVECRAWESGLGGAYLWCRDSGPGAHLSDQVEAIVSGIIQAGPVGVA